MEQPPDLFNALACLPPSFLQRWIPVLFWSESEEAMPSVRIGHDNMAQILLGEGESSLPSFHKAEEKKRGKEGMRIFRLIILKGQEASVSALVATGFCE